MPRINYPFSALVGQDTMRLALILNAINPAIGGVLIRGEKGTAKSTAVRALANLLPKIKGVVGCPFPFSPEELPNDVWSTPAGEVTLRPAPLVNLPLSITEDRLLGTINLQQVLQHGQKHFEAGLLAQAHQGVLYIDEVNLLNDHIVDMLLDVAAMGLNIVERDGVSASHPAQFILVGTMNPEEGELRPQLLDRFGLTAEVAGSQERTERKEIVRRRLAFEANPQQFVTRFADEDRKLQQRLIKAQQHLAHVVLADHLLDLIADICLAYAVDGMRADLVIHKTACTLATWQEMHHVTAEHVQQAAELALPHRQRRQPFEQTTLDTSPLDDLMQQYQQTQREPEQMPDLEDE